MAKPVRAGMSGKKPRHTAAQKKAARLAREGACIPDGLDVVTVSNDGPLDETVATALAALQPVRA